MTFSIVACDLEAGDLGIAVASKFLAVGAVVPWARAGVGAIATQSWANTSYGPRGLDLLASGLSPKEALDTLLAEDEGRATRQVGIIGADGSPAVTYTGEKCFSWAGGTSGTNYACQGNILVGEETVQAMARTFEQSTGSLAERLLGALVAGQNAGGDSRGQQGAALLVVRQNAGYGGFNDRMIDLRVDDHLQPIQELQRLLLLHTLYFSSPDPQDILPIDQALATELQTLLTASGDYQGVVTGAYEEQTQRAFRAFTGRENLEERWFEDALVDRVVLRFLREKFADEPHE